MMTKISKLLFFILISQLFLSSANGNEFDQALAYMKSSSIVFSKIIEKAKPAVVYIEVEKSGTDDKPLSSQTNSFHNDPVLNDFFGKAPEKTPQAISSSNTPSYSFGSGFIYNPLGYILTNAHVIKGGDKVWITLADKRKFQANIIGLDPSTDIGLLKITTQEPLPSIPVGNSDRLKSGDWVLAIGSPHKFIQSVTAGIVSATGRNSIGLTDYENFIQTDAAINPGNSGGPLINIDGKVIGINTAFLTQTGGYMGIGFAIPIDMARKVTEQLISNGKITRAWLGVGLINAELSHLKKAALPPATQAAVIVRIKKNSPAQMAGLQKGDIIMAMDNTRLRGAADLRNRISLTAPESIAKFQIYRGKKEMTIPVKLAELQ